MLITLLDKARSLMVDYQRHWFIFLKKSSLVTITVNKVLEFTNAVFLANVFAVMRLHLSKKKTRWYDAQLEVPSENDAFQIKDKAIFLLLFC